ncbi:SufD family Fe-S cluster assembly protein [Enterobacteriaceae endosymbiont of Macroplea appendiculata]|uniref:SufD family Fe-S cluster assembly protein n=1 Tax=Enterobacteriaceae endosymbiont of Macroplea appendiculata TaxID=2675790 RepID=UPI001B3AF4B9|nr:SufD family Fe-S cluster assembly protein [Enterobacteriaceae endosymbiont of Macroplea appendiculata]
MTIYEKNNFIDKLEKLYILQQNENFCEYKEKYWLQLKKIIYQTNNLIIPKFEQKYYHNKYFTKINIKNCINTITNFFLIKNAICLYFINGFFYQNYSNIENDFYKIIIHKRNTGLSIKNNYYNNYVSIYLAYIFSQQQLTININDITKNSNYTVPVYFLYINTNLHLDQNYITSNYYNTINIHSKNIVLIEHFFNINKFYTNNICIYYNIHDNTQLKHHTIITNKLTNLNNYHNTYYEYNLHKNVKMVKYDCITSSLNIKNINNFYLQGHNSFLTYKSLNIVKKNNLIIHNYLKHNGQNCYSYQLHKTIGIESSRIHLLGNIIIDHIAENTFSKMKFNNLLLDKLSKITVHPELNIYNNNVHSKHSAFIGKISTTQIFFLRTRGIDIRTSFTMLVYGFMEDIVKGFKYINIKDNIIQYIYSNLLT